jgi:hypothetical protein
LYPFPRCILWYILFFQCSVLDGKNMKWKMKPFFVRGRVEFIFALNVKIVSLLLLYIRKESMKNELFEFTTCVNSILVWYTLWCLWSRRTGEVYYTWKFWLLVRSMIIPLGWLWYSIFNLHEYRKMTEMYKISHKLLVFIPRSIILVLDVSD